MNATDLIQNVTLLVTFCAIYRLVSRRLDRRTFWGKVVLGLVFGGVGILSMLSPWRLHQGVVLDGRSVVVGLAGVFGGLLTAAIAVVMTVCYRLFMGGDGALTGCGVIVCSGLLGVVFHRMTQNHPHYLSPLYLYVFGVVTHLFMLAWMVSLPSVEALRVLRIIALPLLLLLPLATLLVGRAFLDQEPQKATEAGFRDSESRLNNLIENALDAIISVDECRRIRIFNKGAESMFGYSAGEVLGQPLERLWPERFVEAHLRHLKEFAASPETARPMVAQPIAFARRKDGSEFPVEATISKHGADAQKLFTVFLRDITRRWRAEETLRRSEHQLRALSARLEKLREEERTRISREIHDELGQMLTGIRMDLRWIEDRLDAFGDDPRVNPILDKLVVTAELTDATTRTVQRIATELRPGVLDKLGLPMALQYEVTQFEERTGIPCRIDLPGESPSMQPEAATACFRIFQEALTNVVRHSQASAVEAELRMEDRGYHLEIRDNGRGLGKVEVENPTSLGLRGMQERARLVGGEVRFSARPGGGTIVAVQIPRSPTIPKAV